MTTQQWIALAGAVLLFFILYFGCSTKPRSIAELEKSRSLALVSTDVSALIKGAREQLDERLQSQLLAQETQLESAKGDTAEVTALKALAAWWYEAGFPAISGHYAQRIAEKLETEESWAIAGTTYTICLQREQEQKIRAFCSEKAVQALENAISMNPAEISHRVNLGLTYAADPPKDNPMKGILLLRELNDQYPDNVLVINSLARLALQTGQYERAVERLEKAIELEPDNWNSICLLAQAYDGLGNQAKAQTFDQKCREGSQRK
ncbi:MAG TPA: tetratricopeptide repeat protein [Saprospiraceae bacterium]|nr:tetratricopeptide repeat protein [Saprospiraceae bacterium]HMQ81693.1 tetratricopeptide repeat protein [Saprospiraceae bacterium]